MKTLNSALPQSILTKKQTVSFTRYYDSEEYGTNRTLTVKLRFDDDCNNGHNTFAITGTIKTSTSIIIACGCMHDEIMSVFPEYAHLIKWHGVTSDGPLGYLENTLYHANSNPPTQAYIYRKEEMIAGIKIAEKCIALVDIQKALEMIEYRPDLEMKLDTKSEKIADIEAARRSAIAPEATLEQLRDREWLSDRLPGLMNQFKEDMIAIGFDY